MDGDLDKNAVRRLVDAYESNWSEYRNSGYQETELRDDFLDPLFAAFGWDMNNSAGNSPAVREVKKEAQVKTAGGTTRKPDYEFRDNEANAAFYLEAKKPAVKIKNNNDPAIQTRQYGWTRGLQISVLSNFEHLVIYDTTEKPEKEDGPAVARIKQYHYTDFVDKFDEIAGYLSRNAVYAGAIEEKFADPSDVAEQITFDDLFLKQLESWRQTLAESAVKHNDNLDVAELNYVVHRVLNRIVFLRIAEDRDLERYKQLKELDEYSYKALEELFEEAEERYNSELFDLLDEFSAENLHIGADAIGEILNELYYPESPYTFAVVESDIIGRIYDLFLGNELKIEDSELIVDEKPEVLNSQGVVSTPDPIVSDIVEESVTSKIKGTAPSELQDFVVADICCGSGVFLTKAYEALENHYRDWYVEHDPDSDVLIEIGGQTRLTYAAQREILATHIRGVDIDQLAVEVTRFNLMLKLLEDQPAAVIDQYERTHADPLLHSLGEQVKQGNSLVDSDFFSIFDTGMETGLQVMPFNFEDAFPDVFANGGFDAIIGNPPYIRIQKMRRYTPDDELEYYSDVYQYRSASKNNYDKYCLFVERALDLVTENGEVGYIISQKFLTIKVGETLRELLAERQALRKLVDFGVDQVFENHNTYTCLIYLDGGGTDTYTVETDFAYEAWVTGNASPTVTSDETATLNGKPWSFVDDAISDLFERVRSACRYQLDDVAHVFVGLQTSRNKAYFLKPGDYEYKNGFYHFTDYKGNAQKVEEGLVRPHLHTTNKWRPSIEPLSAVESNRQLIYPYKDGKVIPPDTLRTEYPHAWNYFTTDEVKKDLMSRDLYESNVPGAFYRYGRKQGFGKLEDNKIVVQVLSLEPRYGLDRNGITNTSGGNGPFYNIRTAPNLPEDSERKVDLDLRYIMAVLSHPVIEAIVRAQSTFFRDGYYSHGGQYIEHVPVKTIDPENDEEVASYEKIIEKTQDHIDLKQRLRSTSTPGQKQTLRTQISTIGQDIQDEVSYLYDLSSEDVVLAEDV